MNKIKALIRLLSGLMIAILLVVFIVSQFATPDMGFIYSVKRLKEKIMLHTKLNPNTKADYYNYLIHQRLTEIEEIYDTGNLAELEVRKISLRYSTTVGEYVQFLLKNKLVDNTKNLYNDISEHQYKLNKILEMYPDSLDYEKKGIQDNVNYLEIYRKQIIESGLI